MRPKRASQRSIHAGVICALRPFAVLAASRARTSSTTAGPISGVSGILIAGLAARAVPRAPGMCTPGGGMKCGGKSIWVPVCSVIS